MSLKKIVMSLLSVLFICPAFAEIDKPKKCPAVVLIKVERLALAREIEPNKYLAFRFSRFNTDNNWVFTLGLISADSPKEAVKEGNTILIKHLNGQPQPEKDAEGRWLCTYLLDNKHYAVAILNHYLVSALQSKRYFA